MKKINAKALVLFVMMVCLTACSSNDDAAATVSQNYKDLILGKWFIKGTTTSGGAFENTFHNCAASKDYFEFLENGDLQYVGYTAECEVGYTSMLMWYIEGETLNIKSFDPILSDMAYTIVTLDKDQMVLKFTGNASEETQTEVSYFTRN